MAIDQAVRAGRCPNASALALDLEVDVRTIRRDMTYMRDQLHAPLKYDSGLNGYRYSEPSFRLAYFQVTEGELMALMLARRVVRQYRGTPFEADLARIFARIEGLLTDPTCVALDTLGDCLTVLPPVTTEYDPAVFAALGRAVVERRRVEVTYHTVERDATTLRMLDPYHMVLRGDDWYVVAHDSHRAEVRVFAVQRVRAARVLDERFERPPGFDVSAYLSSSFRAIPGEGRHEVVLRFRPPTSRRIAEKTWHPSQTIETTPDGLILRFTVGDLREVVRWVMFWGSDCEALGPEELRELVAYQIRELSENYLSGSMD
jgi:predicted DNA-binding transcriptional regulator YafY